MSTISLPRALVGASLAVALSSASFAATVLYTNDFQNAAAHPDWSGWGFTSPSVSGGAITSAGNYINPNFAGSRVWVVDGTLTPGTTAAGGWTINGSSPTLSLAANPSTSLDQITLSLQLSPNIYNSQFTRVILWDGVTFGNRLVSPDLFPGFQQNYSWTLDSFTAVGTGLGGASFSSLMVTIQLNGPTWAWGAADNYKAVYIDNLSLTTSAIPEPSSAAALGGLGALAMVGLRRRRHVRA